MPTSTRRLTLLAAFTSAMLLTSSMTPVSRAVAQLQPSAPHAAEVNAWIGSKYKFCQAELLSQLWKIDIADAKIRVGGMLVAHQESQVDQAIKQAQSERYRCSNPNGFIFDDAKRVADLWTAPAAH